MARFGHAHHDYPATDIFAPCGTTVVSPATGVVLELSRTDRWSSAHDTGDVRGGLSVSIRGRDGVRYYGSHLQSVAGGLRPGGRVAAGAPIGRVGRTGNAAGTPCHLHFGLSPACGTGDWQTRRGVVYPWPYLESWRAGGQLSPAAAVGRWERAHACARAR